MHEQIPRLHADGNTNLEGLIDLISGMLRKAWGDQWGMISDEEPTGSDPNSIPLPRITWGYTRTYSDPMKSLKPRLQGTRPDPDQPGQVFAEYRSWYECDLRFKVWARTGKEARRLTERLEEFIMTYTGAFKFAGISEMFFLRDDDISDDLVTRLGRQDVRGRMLTYKVRTERIWNIRQFTLQEIQTLVQESQLKTTVNLNPSSPIPFV